MSTFYTCSQDFGLAIGEGLRRWAPDRPGGIVKLTWRDAGVNYPGLSFREAQEYTVRLTQAVVDIDIRLLGPADPQGNVNSRFAWIDGENGTLADMQIPSAPSRLHEQLFGRFDRAERDWLTQPIFNLITAHEFYHALGVLHAPRTRADSFMAASLDRDMIGATELDSWTREEVQERYKALSQPPLPPPAPPTPDGFSDVEFWRGVGERLSGLADYLMGVDVDNG